MVYKVWISRNEETLMANAMGRVCKEIREEINHSRSEICNSGYGVRGQECADGEQGLDKKK